MPIVTLKFKLPEEQEEFNLAMKAQKLDAGIHAFDDYLRKKLKYEENITEADHILYASIRQNFWRIINEE